MIVNLISTAPEKKLDIILSFVEYVMGERSEIELKSI